MFQVLIKLEHRLWVTFRKRIERITHWFLWLQGNLENYHNLRPVSILWKMIHIVSSIHTAPQGRLICHDVGTPQKVRTPGQNMESELCSANREDCSTYFYDWKVEQPPGDGTCGHMNSLKNDQFTLRSILLPSDVQGRLICHDDISHKNVRTSTRDMSFRQNIYI